MYAKWKFLAKGKKNSVKDLPAATARSFSPLETSLRKTCMNSKALKYNEKNKNKTNSGHHYLRVCSWQQNQFAEASRNSKIWRRLHQGEPQHCKREVFHWKVDNQFKMISRLDWDQQQIEAHAHRPLFHARSSAFTISLTWACCNEPVSSSLLWGQKPKPSPF